MNQIIDAIQGVTAIMTGISTASDQQNTDISQVNRAIRKMDTVTQQNAELVEQSAAAAESLEEQAQI
jgi:methyl-accepting chemotaxis protein